MSVPTAWPALICLVFAALHLGSELREKRAPSAVFKTLAALSFVAQGALGDPGADHYGRLLFAGLLLAAAGDVLLIPRSRPAVFRLGMLAFGLAHLFYAAGFAAAVDEAAAPLVVVALAGAAVLAAGSWLWLRGFVEGIEKVFVCGYILAISVMIVMSVLAAAGSAPLFVAAGGMMFAVSDLGVARDRFVRPSPLNSLVVVPLYFGAQVLFALSI